MRDLIRLGSLEASRGTATADGLLRVYLLKRFRAKVESAGIEDLLLLSLWSGLFSF